MTEHDIITMRLHRARVERNWTIVHLIITWTFFAMVLYAGLTTEVIDTLPVRLR